MEDYGHKKSHPKVTDFSTMVPKAGLEHRNYPYDLKRLKLNIVG